MSHITEDKADVHLSTKISRKQALFKYLPLFSSNPLLHRQLDSGDRLIRCDPTSTKEDNLDRVGNLTY